MARPLAPRNVLEEEEEPDVERDDRFHLSSILALTTNPVSDGTRAPIDFRIDIEASGWLAYYHYTNRSSNVHGVLPDVHERLAACNVNFDYSMRDSKFSPLNAAREFWDAYLGSDVSFTNNNSNTTSIAMSRPDAVIGASVSITSSAIGYMTSSLFIPQISGSSTATYLSNRDVYRTFSRTVPTNQGDVKALAWFLQNLQITHVGVLFINDGYGNDFHSDLVHELQVANIIVYSHPYENFSLEQSIDRLAASQVKYIIALLSPVTWRQVLRLAYQRNIIGQPDYFWIFGESSLQFSTATFQLDSTLDSDIASALHGSAVVAITTAPYQPLDDARVSFSGDKPMQQLYISQHLEPEIFENYTFPKTAPSIYRYFTYDAVVAMMLAVCESSTDLDDDDDYNNSGSLIHEQLMRTEFQGVSGYVSFDPSTGTRRTVDLRYGVWNIQFPNELISNKSYQVLSTLISVIKFTNSESQVETLAPLYFASNTTVPPLSLPPVVVDMNLIPTSILAFCYSFGGLVIIMSIWWMLWTYSNREKDVVKASQPIFLCQICIGTLIIASAIVPMSMQEPVSERGLNISCMATPWLISVGFVTAFSALFTKTWRLNKLFKNSRNLRRVVIRPRHVILPFAILMTLNIAILLAWSLDAPLVWKRQPLASFDVFGRSVESVGKCVPNEIPHTNIYLSLIVAINISVLIFANYQAYIGRNLPSEYSETTYIIIAMGSLLELFVLGIPLLFFTSSDPSTVFVIRSILVAVTSISLLLPIFLPKYIQRNVNKRYHDAMVATTGSAPVQSRVKVSMGVVSKYSSDGKFKSSYSIDQPSDDVNASSITILAPGKSTIRRNTEYFKEHQAGIVEKNVSHSNHHMFESLKVFKPKTPSINESNGSPNVSLTSDADRNFTSTKTTSSYTVMMEERENAEDPEPDHPT